MSLTYYFRDTHFERLHKIGCFWSAARHRVRGEVFRGALQVYVVLPRLRVYRRLINGTIPAHWRMRHVASEWTGRPCEIHWQFEPGYLQIELRSPSNRRWSWRFGSVL